MRSAVRPRVSPDLIRLACLHGRIPFACRHHLLFSTLFRRSALMKFIIPTLFAAGAASLILSASAKDSGPPPKLVLPGTEEFAVAERPAFIFLPPLNKRTQPQPWIFYAPTLPGYPDESER